MRAMPIIPMLPAKEVRKVLVFLVSRLLKERVSKISYELFFHVTKAIQLDDDGIIFRVKWKERIEQAFMDKFTSIVEEAVSKFI